MWFLNKNTNIKWFIIDKEHIERLLVNDDYEVIKEEIEVICDSKDNEIIDLESLKVKELQELAQKKGIEVIGNKKQDFINAIKKVLNNE